jgi:hypothetical protein
MFEPRMFADPVLFSLTEFRQRASPHNAGPKGCCANALQKQNWLASKADKRVFLMPMYADNPRMFAQFRRGL